jgi:hypothetical protein
MPGRLESISAQPVIREFAQGIAQDAVQPVAGFLAPTVPVSAMVGKFKKYTQKNRFRIPDTLRPVGGRAAELRFEVSDETYNCQPHSLDYPVDRLEQYESEQALGDMFREGAVAIAEVASLSHEKTVIDAGLAAVGAGTSKTWNDAADPVSDLDTAILSVIKACAYGSAMSIGVLFGASAWTIFKNQAKVRGRFIVAPSAPKGGLGLAVPSEEAAGMLFTGSPKVRTSYMVYDTAPEGKDAVPAFLLDSTVLVFARKEQPSRLDPSFMKTFRLANKYMVPGAYTRDDGRVEVAKFDWSEDVKVTNSAAAVRYNVAAS